jgi:quinol-cytochrome oxidoreductase complex cytochrome b subunit
MAEVTGPPTPGSGEGKPFFPHHFVDRVILVLMVVAIMISLATFYPASVEEQADPLLMPEALRPAWYFLPIFQVLRLADRLGWAPGLLGVYGVAIGCLVILSWPWIARVHRGPVSMVLRLVEVAGVLLLVGLTLWGWLA